MSRAPDQKERDRAIAARDQTVLIDAGAGTGKTTLLVDRIVEMVAPADDGPATTLPRIAAVTFTRRAAGELRLRVRQRILGALAEGKLSALRQRRLRDALGAVDTAFLGTIHGFADRLLRLQPMKAKLSPAYAVAEDIGPYVDEAYALLLHAVQNGTLAPELEGAAPEYIEEVERTFQEAFRAGLLVHTQERDPAPPKVGLDGLVRGFIEHRDRELVWKGDGSFDRHAFLRAAKAVIWISDVKDDGQPGTRWLLRLRRRVQALTEVTDFVVLFDLVRFVEKRPKLQKTKHFLKLSPSWTAYLELETTLFDQLLAPLRSAMAARLARTRDAVVLLYEKIKTRHQILDPLDLLLKLRDLLRDDHEARAFYQACFDHILVDEFQDTDPLQAEIVLFLTEAEPRASRWDDVVVGPGRLTIVGDPKQSIYRFRRADIGMYQQIRERIAQAEHVAVTLSANFRSVPELISFGNERLAEVLGQGADGEVFDATTGQVFHQPLAAAVKATHTPAVHHLPYGFADGVKQNADESRILEGQAVAAYLRWLVERGGVEVRDVDSNEPRPLRYSHIAVLGLVTTKLPLLFNALDEANVPYAMSGGVLFTSDPVHKQFVLGLRALADRNDGVAEAALLRPPFFAIDLLDLIHDKVHAESDRAVRAKAARDWLRETRRLRAQRSPGMTARALLEETGFGRAIALGPNGSQRLSLLRELCLQLELMATRSGLDFDSVTARMRDWVDQPPHLDPPRPVGREAVQVLSVHQAKGLEFPVVVLWDGVGQWRAYEADQPWRVDRSAKAWAMSLEGLKWEEPRGVGLLDREKKFAEQEKRRLIYVAATRARDLLIVPKPTWEQGEGYIHATLLAGSPDLLTACAPFVHGEAAPWARALAPFDGRVRDGDDRATGAAWSALWASATRSRQAPAAVTAVAKAQPSPNIVRVDDVEVEQRPPPARQSRFGPVFGETVHRAIGLMLKRALSPRDAVAVAAVAAGLQANESEAIRDVERAISALSQAGLIGTERIVRLEYPIASPGAELLVAGYVDLVSTTLDGGDCAVIDFKTDSAPEDAANITHLYPDYVRQVGVYVSSLAAERGALLFTATGQLAWVDPIAVEGGH